MQLGMIGLGRMGHGMTERLREGGHDVRSYDPNVAERTAGSLEELKSQLESPRAFWLMIPAGKITEDTIPEQAANPYDVCPDLDGNIWFPDSPTVDRSAMIGKFNTKDQTFTFYPKPQFSADTPKIQVTRDGAIWFAPRGSLMAPAISVRM